jgi:uncharacterized phage protein gp47/JayE
MPNLLDPSGLAVKSVTEIINDLTLAMQEIYGADINLDSDSPDGQLLNIYAQAAADNLELLADVYNSFSPSGAYGTILDQRMALNGLARHQGTFTLIPLSVTVTQALTLPGQDTAQPFTVSDNAGNQYQLVASHSFGAAGTTVLTFACTVMGLITPALNTITNQVTAVLGVTSVNNPTAPLALGVREETDSEFKIRHARSFALAATGPADSVQAALANIPSVTDAYVVENATAGTVGGVAANTIWCIVTGGTDAEIAQAIYAKKGLGCGMKGAKSHVITRPNGTGFTAKWDASLTQRLYAKFELHPRTQGQTFDNALIASQLSTALVYKLSQQATVGDIVNAMLLIEPASYQVSIAVSTDGTNWFDSVEPSDVQHYFTLASADITIT